MELHDDIIESLRLSKENDETLDSAILTSLRDKELNHLDDKNYVMLTVHQLKLITSNGIGMPLILLEGLRIDIVQT